MHSHLVLLLLLSCSAGLSDTAPDDSFLKAVWDDAVADRDALRSALISAESALAAAISVSPEIEGLPCPRALTNARLTVDSTRNSLLSAEARTNALFQAATATASTSRDPEAARVSSESPLPEDRKGKRPAPHEDIADRTVQEPPDGWLDRDGKLHRRRAGVARDLQSDLNLVFNIYDSAFTPIADLQVNINNDSPIEPSSPASPANLLSALLAIASIAASMSHSISKKAKTLHVEHEYGQEIAQLFAKEDLLGEKGSADNKKLKKAIDTARTLRSLPSSSSKPSRPARRAQAHPPQSAEPRSDPDRRGRSAANSPRPSDPSEVTCFRCKKKGHFSKNCPSSAR